MSGWVSLSWEGKRSVVMHEAHYWCEMCGEAAATEVDHIWPKSLGGSDQRYNLRAACRTCNAAKGQAIRVADITRDPGLITDGFLFDLRKGEDGAADAVRWKVLRSLLYEGVESDSADECALNAIGGIRGQIRRLVDETVDNALTPTVVQVQR